MEGECDNERGKLLTESVATEVIGERVCGQRDGVEREGQRKC